MFFVFFYCAGAHRDLHSFPTRRSSDLDRLRELGFCKDQQIKLVARESNFICQVCNARLAISEKLARFILVETVPVPRSEEHTSELQSHVNLVCRLLLEKKKKQKQIIQL